MAGISYKLPGSLANKFKYNGIELNERDGMGIAEIKDLQIIASTDAELLLIEVPMEIK